MSKSETIDRRILYVGADDSNHAGKNKKGEMHAVIFSYNRADSAVKNQSNRRDWPEMNQWLSNPERDYRFTLLTDEESRRRSYNLVLTVPLMLKEYLLENDPDHRIEELRVCLDGSIRGRSKNFIKNDFPDYRVNVEGFTKKVTKGRKRVKCLNIPTIVHMADTLVSGLYNDFEPVNLLNHTKMITLSQQEILNRDLVLRSQSSLR